MTEKSRTSAHQSPSDCEQVTDPGRIVSLLERLAKQHALLTADIPGHQEHYTSSIVGVDRSHVLLDELMPTGGHERLLAKRTLQVTGKLDGIDIWFSATLERVEEGNDMVTYHMNLPGLVEYRQRRLAYRAHIPLAQTLRVVIDSRDGTAIEGELHDLSRGGAGMVFPDDSPAALPGLLCECAIELLGDVWLYCAAELRYSKSIHSGAKQLIGARFNKLSPAQARLVGHCVSELEREYVRKRVAG